MEVLKNKFQKENEKKEPICYSCSNFFIETHCHRAENMCRKNHFWNLEEEPEIEHCIDFKKK